MKPFIRYSSLMLVLTLGMLSTAWANQKPADEQELALGKKVYDAKCKMCHRADGKGTLEEMDLTDNVWKHGNSPEDIEKVIREGIKGTGMRAIVGDHTDQEIKALVKFVLSFSPPGGATAAPPASSKDASTPGAAVSGDSTRGKNWDVFEFPDLVAKRDQSKRPYLEFLKVPTLSAGIYSLPADGQDQQKPHAQDEVYYIASGRAMVQIGKEDVPVQPGSVVFVKAGIEHRFHSIKEELKILVFFSAAP
jgi:mannose-6-phosphate isomerase-like protein (cupin superfamily)/mono/diheme cytochrome c family protein